MIVAAAGPIAFLTEKQAARLLSLSHRTLQAWRRAGSGPAFVRLGRTIRYSQDDLLAWANANRQG
jgi:excisionase family DNA binding protein